MTLGTNTDESAPAAVSPSGAKRGPKWKEPWQGDLGQFQGGSPREAVAEAILDLVRRGELRPGMRLPSEPQLAEMSGISRTSVREAVRGLQSIGILEIRRGQGTFVSDISASSVVDAQMVMLLENRRALLDLVEVRSEIEPMIARLAAERADERDVAGLEKALEEMERQHDDHAGWRIAHLEFHSCLAAATKNVIAMKVWGLIVLFLRDSPLVTGSHPIDDIEVHRSILDAVANHDVDAALTAMGKHVDQMIGAVE